MKAININHKSNKLYFPKDYAFYNHVISSRDYVCVIWASYEFEVNPTYDNPPKGGGGE